MVSSLKRSITGRLKLFDRRVRKAWLDWRTPPSWKRPYFDFLDGFGANGINICYNSEIPKRYDPSMQNVLLAIESPAVVEHSGWLKPDMKFIAEISFGNFCKLDQYHCCRDLYVANDFFLDLDLSRDFSKEKTKDVSLIYSHNVHLPGHRLRHEIAENLTGRFDLFGSGTNGGKFERKNSSHEPYRFHVVIENGRYPDYVSEKFFDAVKTLTIPIYWGGDPTRLGFDPRGYYTFNTKEELIQILIKKANGANYAGMLPYAQKNLRRLVVLRNNFRMGAYFAPLYSNYLHTMRSYLGESPKDKIERNIKIEQI